MSIIPGTARKTSVMPSGQGKEEARMSRFFRKGDKESEGLGVPMQIPSKSLIVELKESSSRRTALQRAKTENHLISRRNRALSPTTKRRMEIALGIGDTSVVSAPTIIYHDDNISQARSAPLVRHERKDSKNTKIAFKRHSIEFDGRETMSRNHNSTRSMRSGHQSITFDESIVDKKIGRMGKGNVESTAAQSVASTQLVSKRKTDMFKANVKIPKGTVSIVITDIQGSTMMWEQDPSAMKDALDVHDAIVRKCYTKQAGYEITTEGDSFHLAFHHPVDALSFCLDCQTKLFNANWSNGILALEDAKHDPDRQMRGLRVRMAAHHGQTTSATHEITHRTYFKGEGVVIAKALEKTSHGGQIITNVETWKAVSGMAERYLGSPQILDLGKHDLNGKEIKTHNQRLLQLVPKRLAFDYCAFRGTSERPQRPRGRTFPPPKTYRQLSTGFFDAPYLKNKVTIVFINIVAARELDKKHMSEQSRELAKMIRSLLIRTRPPGYECQEGNGSWMLAFHCIGSSIMFGLNLIHNLKSADSPLLAKVGIHCGDFTSMGPHTITGRADYFGTVVNRAARIAANSETGQVRLGISKSDLKDFQPPKIKEIQVDYLGTEIFKGIIEEICLFACIPLSRKESELNTKNGKIAPRRMSLIHDTAKSP